MIPADRVSALLERRPVDRVPFFPLAQGFCAVNAGYPIANMHNDPQTSLEAQLRTRDKYDYDGPPFYRYATYGTWEAEGWSSELLQRPSEPGYPVRVETGIEGLRLPDVTKAGMLPFAMRFSRLQQEHGLPVTVVVGGVFTIAANICGLKRLCILMLESPDVARRLVRMAGDHVLGVVQHWVSTFGARQVMPFVWEDLATNRILSPEQFETFVLPHQRRLHEEILSLGVEHILCHICGEQRLNLSCWRRIPMGAPGIVSVSHEVDIETAGENFPDDIIMGSIDPAVVEAGRPGDVCEVARTCIEKGRKHPGGFILAPGCELPAGSPPDNVWMIMKAVDDFGRYK